MSLVPLPNGAKLSLATTIGAAVAIASVSNANPAVVTTAAAHNFDDNGIVLLSLPGLQKVDNQVRRVMDGADATHFLLPGLDTTSVDRFPVGAGAGAARIISGWTPVSKVAGFESTGGDAKTGTSSYLDYDDDLNYITGANGTTINLRVSYQPDSAQEQALIAASDSGDLQVLRLVLKNGAALYYPGQLHFNPNPTMAKDNEMVNSATLVLQGAVTRFAKAV